MIANEQKPEFCRYSGDVRSHAGTPGGRSLKLRSPPRGSKKTLMKRAFSSGQIFFWSDLLLIRQYTEQHHVVRRTPLYYGIGWKRRSGKKRLNSMRIPAVMTNQTVATTGAVERYLSKYCMKCSPKKT